MTAKPGPPSEAMVLHKKWHKTCYHPSEGPCEQADAIRALEARVKKVEANSKRLRASLKSAWIALNRLVMRRDIVPISYYKGRAEEIRAVLWGKP